MRRTMVLGLILGTLAVMLAGCRPLVQPEPQVLSIYATFYPIYALADAVILDIPDIRLHCLVQPQDGCLRSYRLSDWDAALLASANGVISGGRGLESFESTLFGWGESGPAVAAVLYNLELYNQGDSSAASDRESHLRGENPHLYMSLDGAGEILQSISAMMVSMDPRYAEQYAKNTGSALSQLEDAACLAREIMAPYSGQPVILMNEALIYPARDYGLEVKEWIDRESAEALYDEELNRCIQKLRDSGAKVILIEQQAPQSMIQSLEEAGFSVARLNVFSTGREGQGFSSYIQTQINNARAIRSVFERADNGEATD